MNTEISLEPEVIEVKTVDIITTGNEATYQVTDADLGMNYERREFNIVGDDVYIGKTLQEMPSWLQTYINDLALNAVNDKVLEVNQLIASVSSLVESMNVAKNAYESAVLSFSDAEARMNMKYETLDSSVADSNAQIVNLLSTYATKDNAASTALSILDASIANTAAGSLGAKLINLDNAIVGNGEAIASSQQALMSVLTDSNNGLVANSTAIETLNTYVRTDINGPDSKVAEALNKLITTSNQLDNQILYTYGAGVPQITYQDGSERERAHNNVYYDTTGKVAYRFNSIDNIWVIAEDLSQLMSDISIAKASADGKMIGFNVKFEYKATDVTPTGVYSIGDYIVTYKSLTSYGSGSLWTKLWKKNTSGVIVDATSEIKSGDIISGTRSIMLPGKSIAENIIVAYRRGTGLWTELDGRVVAGADWAVDMSADVIGTNGLPIAGTSKLANNVYVDSNGVAHSKFEYDSTVTIGGVAYPAGFGIKNMTNNGGVPDSEFWINADKFKMTNNNGATPNAIPVFSIDTNDGNKVHFNGKVTFSSDNIIGIPTHTSGTVEPTGTAVAGSTYTNTSTTPATVYMYNGGWKVTGTPGALTQSTLNTALADNTTVIDGGKITTGYISANRISSGVIYDETYFTSNGTSYSMKIDLNTGYIHIK